MDRAYVIRSAPMFGICHRKNKDDAEIRLIIIIIVRLIYIFIKSVSIISLN